MKLHRTRRPWQALAIAGLAAIALVGCSSSSDSSSASNVEAYSVAEAETAAAGLPEAPAADGSGSGWVEQEDAGAEAPPPEGGTAPLDPTVITADREVIRTATVTVEVEVATSGDDDTDSTALRDAVADATLKVRALVGAEGYVSATDSSGRVAVVTLRIPATGYQAAIEGLAAIGEVSSLQEQAQDVTAQIVDLESRVKTMTASVERVRALLAGATDLQDVVDLESELASREADLESLQQQRAALAGQAALSTVTVTLTGSITGSAVPVADEPLQESTGFLAGLRKGWDAFVDFGAGVLGVVGAVLPFLPVLAVLGLLGWLLVRALNRRSARLAPAPAGPSLQVPPSAAATPAPRLHDPARPVPTAEEPVSS